MKRRIDDFRPYTAKQIAFLNRGKGIDVPDVQSAIEEVKSMVDEIDHSHRGQGENSIQLGPDSIAFADYSVALGTYSSALGDYSIAFGHIAYTSNDGRRSIALGHGAGASSESSVAIGDGANSFSDNGIAIGRNAVSHSSEIGGSISIGTHASASDKGTAIGEWATANRSHAVAIGVNANSPREHAIAIGTEAEASGIGGIALGNEAKADKDGSIAIGSQAESGSWEGGNIAIGQGAMAYFERSIAIGSGAEAGGRNAVAIGPGAVVNEDNTIVLGTPGHIVIIPGELKVLGRTRTSLSWIAPSDDIIAEMSGPLYARSDGEIAVDEKSLTLRNPGRYRIKGYINADSNAWARFNILESGTPIVETVFINEDSEHFSLDFTRDIGVNTTLTFRLEVGKISGSSILSVTASVSAIRVCGTEMDIGSGVIGW